MRQKDIDIEKLKELIEKGYKVMDIAKELDIATSTLYINKKYRKYIKNKGTKVKRNLDKIKEDIKNGCSIFDVSDKYNIPVGSLYTYIRVKQIRNSK